MDWEDLLGLVERPSRYLGGEINASHKGETAEVRFVLAFPDTYEVGMSHLGIQILYALLNRLPVVAAERCFAPWPDMEQLLRKHNLPLRSLESGRPLSAFDVVGFSLQYELSYTNVLNMLELGGIPLHSSDRREGYPLVIAGGPCAFNPAPLAAFIDAFVIGEGEEAILEIAAAMLTAKQKGWKREDALAALGEIEGIYIPALHRGDKKIRKRVLSDLSLWHEPRAPVVPLMKTVHDRITLEIARGCTRGCRFCQAGMVWRPVRERGQEILEKMAESELCATGYDEISLLSLSSGDYTYIEPLLTALMERYYERRVALALPSLRVETLTRRLMEGIRRVRKTSFTLAPEAGTQRLRNIINKGNTEAELLATTREVFAAGWKSLKLYFMIGLPEEGIADLEGIAELAYRVLQEGKQRGQVTVSLSTFVPKAHTPFQWQRQISLPEISEKQAFLKGRIRNRNLSLKWHDGRMSLLEGIFSRGDGYTGRLIEEAFRLGCRFDGWAEMFRFDLWEEAMARTNIDIDRYLGGRKHAEELPWEVIDCGVGKSFLISEDKKALAGELTADCRLGLCHDCGVCDHKTIKVITASSPDPFPFPADRAREILPQTKAETTGYGGERGLCRLRVRFMKQREARFLSHLEISEALIRAIKRNGMSFAFSQGHHPHPKISFAFATSVGMESMEEYADITVFAGDRTLENSEKEISAFLPSGLEIGEIRKLSHEEGSLTEAIRGFSYAITLPPLSGSELADLQERMTAFLSSGAFPITRETKGKKMEKDIRRFVSSLELEEGHHRIILSLRINSEGTARPMEVLTQALGIRPELARTARIVKIKTHWAMGDG